MVFAVVRDRHAVDVLEDDVWMALIRDAAIQQSSDVGMREARQDLALGKEALAQRRVARGADQLDGHALLELTVRTLRIVYDAHAPTPQLADHTVRPDACW